MSAACQRTRRPPSSAVRLPDYVPGMSDHEHEPREQVPASPDDAAEYRSASATLFEGMKALGAATGGLGTLGLGAAAVKQTFGTKQSPEPKPPAGDQPSREQSTD